MPPAIPLDIAPFTLVGRHHQGRACCQRRCATGSASPRTWTSTSRTSSASSCAGRPACSAWRCATTAPTRSPAGPAARRGSPTGCCAGSATSPRCAATAWSPGTAPGRRWSCTRWTRAAWTGSTGRVLRRLVRRFGGGPVGLSTLAVAVGEEAETVEVVAEPFLVRAGLIARTPRGPGGDAGGLGAPGPAAARVRPPAGRPGRLGADWAGEPQLIRTDSGPDGEVTAFRLSAGARPGRNCHGGSRPGHDHSSDAVACWCAACAPLHCGSWSKTRHFGAATGSHRHAPASLLAAGHGNQLEGCPSHGDYRFSPPPRPPRAPAAASCRCSSSSCCFACSDDLHVPLAEQASARRRRTTQSQVMNGSGSARVPASTARSSIGRRPQRHGRDRAGRADQDAAPGDRRCRAR